MNLVWSPSPSIVDLGFTQLRWYGLLFATGFILSQQVMFRIFKAEGKPERDVETLTFYMVIATIIGARLGHVLFYEPARYFAHPLEILKIWEGGLASHGGAIGILIGLYLYAKKKPGQSYMWLLDRLVIVVALTGAMIRCGNFVNSEIIGKPTGTKTGVVFGHDVERRVQYATNAITAVDFERADDNFKAFKPKQDKYVPVEIKIDFKKGNEEAGISFFLTHTLKTLMAESSEINMHVYQPSNEPLQYDLTQKDGHYEAKIYTWGIARHPAQLYESFSCIILFLVLFYLWNKKKENLPSGLNFGIFLIVCFGLRFLYEFLKENQVPFESHIPLNMGQWLSIPLIIAGIIILVRALKQPEKTT